MKRGEVWWANLPPPVGRRPVVLLSRDAAYAVRSQIVVVPVTTTVRGIRAEVTLGTAEGLSKVCAANLDVIVTIAKSCLDTLVGQLSSQKMLEMEAAIRYALGMP
jgi:mRNA interferase MazF